MIKIRKFNPFIFTALIEIFSIILLTLVYVSHLFYFYFNLLSVVSFPVSFPPSPPSLHPFYPSFFNIFVVWKLYILLLFSKLVTLCFFYQHWQSTFFTCLSQKLNSQWFGTFNPSFCLLIALTFWKACGIGICRFLLF